jgi:uncharacterized protein
LSKEDVRRLARAARLKVWDKPQAACLSSRIPHGTRVSIEALAAIERAEQAVHDLGFEVVRVRHFDGTARVEVGAHELAKAADKRDAIIEAVRSAGYERVSIDRYRRGGARLPLAEA